MKVRRDILVVTCVMSQQKSSGLTEGDGEWTHMKFRVLFRIISAQGIMSTEDTDEKVLDRLQPFFSIPSDLTHRKM